MIYVINDRWWKFVAEETLDSMIEPAKADVFGAQKAKDNELLALRETYISGNVFEWVLLIPIEGPSGNKPEVARVDTGVPTDTPLFNAIWLHCYQLSILKVSPIASIARGKLDDLIESLLWYTLFTEVNHIHAAFLFQESLFLLHQWCELVLSAYIQLSKIWILIEWFNVK